MNRVILFGNVGVDPAVKHLESGKIIAKFSLATNKSYKDSIGEKITETQWHNIVLWNKLAELAEKYVKKGSSIIIEGEINYRSYENKEKQTVYITEIIVDRLHFAGKPEEKKQDLSKAENDPSYIPENIDDIPFE